MLTLTKPLRQNLAEARAPVEPRLMLPIRERLRLWNEVHGEPNMPASTRFRHLADDTGVANSLTATPQSDTEDLPKIKEDDPEGELEDILDVGGGQGLDNVTGSALFLKRGDLVELR